jgi:cation diffusion facilitator CzcD-associated flavoprotein CzcO
MLDLIIIGAGPYGISLATHAIEKKLSYKLLGYPMDFWKNQMPQNMFIRTPHDFVNFSDPANEFTIQRFGKETGTKLVTPLPRPIFVEYAFWFVKKTGVQFTPELVESVTVDDRIFTVKTEKEIYTARNVIVATGVQHFKYIPEVFHSLPDSLVSHTSGYTDFYKFNGKKVAVVGSGQSAWEAAALLHEANADVELIYRQESVKFAGSKLAERSLKMLRNVFYKLPKTWKQKLGGQSSATVAHFLRPYVENKVPETAKTWVEQVETTPDGKVLLKLTDGTERIVDHIISATGFRMNLDRLPFLCTKLKKDVIRESRNTGFPQLDQNFESSVPGLYFAGPLSAGSHGPTFKFILVHHHFL